MTAAAAARLLLRLGRHGCLLLSVVTQHLQGARQGNQQQQQQQGGEAAVQPVVLLLAVLPMLQI
jgi:hypothetical protein